MTNNWKLGNLFSVESRPKLPTVLIMAALGITGASSLAFIRFQSSSLPPQQEALLVEPIKTVTTLGRLEPKGEVIRLSASGNNIQGGNRVEVLLVKEGQEVKSRQVIALMDSHSRNFASLKEAQKQVQIAQARLNRVLAGAEQGEITARTASVARLQAELEGQTRMASVEIKRLQAQLNGDTATQNATIKRLEAELQGQKLGNDATVARIEAEKLNTTADVQRYEDLFKEGVISNQEVARRRLMLQTSTQQLAESQANRTRIIASIQEQINEAKANRDKTVATLTQQINSAQANRDKTVATLQQQINEAKGTLKEAKEVRPTDVAVAQAEIDGANATVQKIKAELAMSYIRAPEDGRVMKINTHPGEIVGNQGILELGQTSQMYAVAEVYQSDINKVRPGQKVRIISDITSDLRGTLERVGTQVQRQTIINGDPSSNLDNRVIEVYVRLDQASSKKAANLTNLQVQAIIEL